jgi:hypothetical protein
MPQKTLKDLLGYSQEDFEDLISDYESINFLDSDKNKLFSEADTKKLIEEKQQHISSNAITQISLSKNHLMQNNALELIEIAKIEALGLENIK